ncbi:integrase core domain-containing protein [Amycolatopsis sp. H20-H5]|uniref:integrase core domain-containing protein n=1 Tax=Amycolatopsis sp. H20-H5 TaxID=3046309 RepID=UPI003FA3C05C
MGRVGSCYDNAVAESFFATLKTEIGTQVWATRDDARRAVFAYLGYYNHDHLHSTLDYRTPHETRMSYRHNIAHAAQTPVPGSRGEPQPTGLSTPSRIRHRCAAMRLPEVQSPFWVDIARPERSRA